MLPRAFARSLRTQPIIRNGRPLPIAQQLRFYAKPSRPSRPPPPKPRSAAPPISQNPTASQIISDAQNTRSTQSRDDITNSPSLQARFRDIDRDIQEDLSRHQDGASPSDPVEPSSPDLSQSLPDLTQGIPSTLDAELDSQRRGEATGPLDITESSEPPADQRGGSETPKSAYVSSQERQKRKLLRTLLAFATSAAVAATAWYGRNWDTEEEERRYPEAPSGWGLILFYNRLVARSRATVDHYTEPSFPKLLPDVSPEFERPYTLVVALEDLLVHGEWTREHGWRVAKRPGVDYFLRYLHGYYEIVIWSSTLATLAGPVIQKMDPFQVATWPLFREATRYENGEYVKDISYLNRDPAKVIVLDTNPAATAHQPENAIILPKWGGEPSKHKDLVAMIPFLEYCAALNFEDLRKVLKSFEGTNIPEEFARREAVFREKYQAKMAEGLKKRKSSGSAFGGVFSAIAGPSPNKMVDADGKAIPTLADAIAQGKTYQDLVRERGQMQYEYINKQLEENGELMVKQAQEEDKKRQEEGMREYGKSLSSWLPFMGSNGDAQLPKPEGEVGKTQGK